MASYEKEKEATVAIPSPPSGGEEGLVAVHDEAEGLTILGYRPELKRNRSMFTLLFQSLAIAAVRVNPAHLALPRMLTHDSI